MSWTLCTSGAAIFKSGIHVNSDLKVSGAILAKWSDEAEGRIEGETGVKWVDNINNVDTGIKNLLSDICSSIIAKQMVAFDTTGYLSSESDNLLNINDDIENKGLKRLEKLNRKKLKAPEN